MCVGRWSITAFDPLATKGIHGPIDGLQENIPAAINTEAADNEHLSRYAAIHGLWKVEESLCASHHDRHMPRKRVVLTRLSWGVHTTPARTAARGA